MDSNVRAGSTPARGTLKPALQKAGFFVSLFSRYICFHHMLNFEVVSLIELSSTSAILTSQNAHTAAQQLYSSVYLTLRYFEFFEHALFSEEVHKYVSVKSSRQEVLVVLNALYEQGDVVCKDGLWAMHMAHIELRLKHIDRNRAMIKAAKFVGVFIHRFPYVRGVYLSGSLSKHGVTGKDDDLDFFIIAKAGRVWAAKLFLIAFKKIFLLNSEKYFCINLLMSEEELILKKRNIYIATEAASLVPLTNAPLLDTFLNANSWIQEYFPNQELISKVVVRRTIKPLEAIIETIAGRALERKAHNMFLKHVEQQRKASGYYDTSEGVSAYFPESVEEQLLAFLAQKSDSYE